MCVLSENWWPFGAAQQCPQHFVSQMTREQHTSVRVNNTHNHHRRTHTTRRIQFFLNWWWRLQVWVQTNHSICRPFVGGLPKSDSIFTMNNVHNRFSTDACDVLRNGAPLEVYLPCIRSMLNNNFHTSFSSSHSRVRFADTIGFDGAIDDSIEISGTNTMKRIASGRSVCATHCVCVSHESIRAAFHIAFSFLFAFQKVQTFNVECSPFCTHWK